MNCSVRLGTDQQVLLEEHRHHPQAISIQPVAEQLAAADDCGAGAPPGPESLAGPCLAPAQGLWPPSLRKGRCLRPGGQPNSGCALEEPGARAGLVDPGRAPLLVS